MLEAYLRMADRQWRKKGTEAIVAESDGDRLEITGRKRVANNMQFKRRTLRLGKQFEMGIGKKKIEKIANY